MKIQVEKRGYNVRYYGEPAPKNKTERKKLCAEATREVLRAQGCTKYEVRDKPIAGPKRDREVIWGGDLWSMDELLCYGRPGETYVIYGYRRVGHLSDEAWELHTDVEVTF